MSVVCSTYLAFLPCPLFSVNPEHSTIGAIDMLWNNKTKMELKLCIRVSEMRLDPCVGFDGTVPVEGKPLMMKSDRNFEKSHTFMISFITKKTPTRKLSNQPSANHRQANVGEAAVQLTCNWSGISAGLIRRTSVPEPVDFKLSPFPF